MKAFYIQGCWVYVHVYVYVYVYVDVDVYAYVHVHVYVLDTVDACMQALPVRGVTSKRLELRCDAATLQRCKLSATAGLVAVAAERGNVPDRQRLKGLSVGLPVDPRMEMDCCMYHVLCT
jgi:hypothetical protein